MPDKRYGGDQRYDGAQPHPPCSKPAIIEQHCRLQLLATLTGPAGVLTYELGESSVAAHRLSLGVSKSMMWVRFAFVIESLLVALKPLASSPCGVAESAEKKNFFESSIWNALSAGIYFNLIPGEIACLENINDCSYPVLFVPLQGSV